MTPSVHSGRVCHTLASAPMSFTGTTLSREEPVHADAASSMNSQYPNLSLVNLFVELPSSRTRSFQRCCSEMPSSVTENSETLPVDLKAISISHCCSEARAGARRNPETLPVELVQAFYNTLL